MPRIRHREFVKRLEKASAFNFKLVESRLGKNYAKVFIHNLKRRGRIIELIKGWYSFKKSPYLITVPLGEAYIGLGTAAFLHNAWAQIPNIDVLTPRAPIKVKTGERVIAGRKVVIRRLSRQMYFGYGTMYLDEAKDWVRVSDPEKTLIDLIYYNYPFLDEISPRLLEMVEKKKLTGYLKRIRGIRGSKKIEKKVKEFLSKKSKKLTLRTAPGSSA
ncbi:MAG: type IV toxin-antitoxin system AbiEi family antitoxin [Candidatus Aenigmatarchaeota archaeon]